MNILKWIGYVLAALLVLALVAGAAVFAGIIGIVLGFIMLVVFFAALIREAFESK